MYYIEVTVSWRNNSIKGQAFFAPLKEVYATLGETHLCRTLLSRRIKYAVETWKWAILTQYTTYLNLNLLFHSSCITCNVHITYVVVVHIYHIFVHIYYHCVHCSFTLLEFAFLLIILV